MINPVAFYDCLVIGDRVSRRVGNVVPQEIHLFSYLSCLLAVYRGWPSFEWGYRFACADSDAPYSYDVQEAIDESLALGYLNHEDGVLSLSAEGIETQSFLSSLESNQKRLPLLEGACECLLGMSIGTVRQTMAREPTLRRAVALSRNQLLLDDIGHQLVYEEFQMLTDAIGADAKDLIVPALLWLTALAYSAEDDSKS